MGSCYSTTKVVQGKRSDNKVEVDSTSNAKLGSSVVVEETGSKSPLESSPLRQQRSWSRRHNQQRHGSGGWRRKRSLSAVGWDETGPPLWGSDGVEIPGRLCVNGASRIACLYTQQGKKGTNQDAMVVWENFASRDDTVFCGIFDGHGPYGHLVARKIRDSLPIVLSTRWKSDGDGDFFDDEEWCDEASEEEKKFPEMFRPLRQSMLSAFRSMDKDLKLHPTIDCFCSGSTAVALVRQNEHLVIGNVGDSRAVLATRDENGNLIARQLTVDLKPDLPREEARIRQCKGRVFALQDEPEVARVWLPNSDSPGLAMARAFGDFCLKDFGLIAVPEVCYHVLGERDEFVVLATDGVWDVISNREAVEIMASAPGGPRNAARALVDCAVRAWRLKYPTSKNDDCTAVCLFLGREEPEKPEGSRAVEVENGSNEIVVEDVKARKSPSKRSLAEYISSAEDEEGDWSALEGVTRVNSLLSLPRFLSGDKRSGSWRKKWL